VGGEGVGGVKKLAPEVGGGATGGCSSSYAGQHGVIDPEKRSKV
jgi:hypothetical protein